MFTKAALIALVASVFGAVAGAPTGGPTPSNVSQCNTGDAQCCNSITSAKDESTSKLLGLLGVVVQGVDVAVGLGCTPITVLVGGVKCTQQPVCCTGNNFNGLVNVGCTPISL